MIGGLAEGSNDNVAQPTVRRLIVYVLLFALVVIAAIGLAGLLGRLLSAGNELVAGDVAGLARSLAFALIGGPIAAVLWWVVWRRADEPSERSSLAWGLYLAGISTVSLVTFVSALLTAATSLVDGAWQPRAFATGVVWAGVWAWHRWMLWHPAKRPALLLTVPPVIGAVYGLVVGVGGTVSALGTLLDTAIRGFADAASVGYPWWRPALDALVWAVGGALVWWWSWIHDGASLDRTGLSDVTLIVVGILGAAVLTLGGAGVALFVLLRLAFDRTDPLSQLLDPLGEALAAAAVGALVWAYHRGVALRRSPATREAVRLVTSGITLIAAASGIGVIVNSLLATAAPVLAGAEPRTLLLGGISSLIVGGPLWWLVWKPTAPVDPAVVGSTGRRVYLIAVFGLSAVVALIAILVIGNRVFEFALDNTTGGSLVERIRAPLGVLLATGLAFGYHFGVWRRDRAAINATGAARKRTIGRVVLVTASDPAPLARVIAELTGASVTAWLRADREAPVAAGREVPPTGGRPAAPDAGPDAGQLAAALAGVTGKRVLVIAGPGNRVEVIPLKE